MLSVLVKKKTRAISRRTRRFGAMSAVDNEMLTHRSFFVPDLVAQVEPGRGDF